MIRGVLTIAPFVSAFFFPWPLTVLLALAAAVYEPLVPLGAGLFLDTLYFAPETGSWPLFTLGGLFITGLTLFLRTRLVR